MQEKPEAVVAGHLCLDIFPGMEHLPRGEFSALFQPGHLIEVGPTTQSTGGPVSNTGLALHKLGIRTRLMGKVGSDRFGAAVLDIVRSFGEHLAAGMVVDEGSTTSYTIAINPPGLDRIFLHCPGANNTFQARDVRFDLVGEAQLFHFGYPPLMGRMFAGEGEELLEVFRRARETGVTTSLDMVYPDPASPAGKADWAAILKKVLPCVDIFLPSWEEMLIMVRPEWHARWLEETGGVLQDRIHTEALRDLTGEMIGRGVAVAGLKLGDRGFYIRTAGIDRIRQMGRACPKDAASWAGRELWSPCFEVEVAGTTGAGDATIAGFLTALLKGMAPDEAMTAAVAVGGCNVEAPDALGGLRSWEDTLARISRGWAKKPMSSPGPGWVWNPACQIWMGQGGE